MKSNNTLLQLQSALQYDIIDIKLMLYLMSMMRTTLTIDDDIAARVEALRKGQGLSLKQAVNLLLRTGLEAHSMPQQTQRFRTKPRKLGLRSGFDHGKLNQLVDELEVETRLAKLQQR